jgi:hypothetical protein
VTFNIFVFFVLASSAIESGEFFRDAVLNLVGMPKMCAHSVCLLFNFASCALELFQW